MDIESRVALAGVTYAGNHGLEIRGPQVPDFVHDDVRRRRRQEAGRTRFQPTRNPKVRDPRGLDVVEVRTEGRQCMVCFAKGIGRKSQTDDWHLGG